MLRVNVEEYHEDTMVRFMNGLHMTSSTLCGDGLATYGDQSGMSIKEEG